MCISRYHGVMCGGGGFPRLYTFVDFTFSLRWYLLKCKTGVSYIEENASSFTYYIFCILPLFVMSLQVFFLRMRGCVWWRWHFGVIIIWLICSVDYLETPIGKLGPGWLSQYSDWLRAGQSGDWIPVGAKFYTHIQIGPGAHPPPSSAKVKSM
jgi:hypothetical protein